MNQYRSVIVTATAGNSHELEAFYQVLLTAKCCPFRIVVIAIRSAMKTKPWINIDVIVIAVNLGYSTRNASFRIAIAAAKNPWRA